LPQGRGRHEHFRGPYYKRDEHRMGAYAVASDAAAWDAPRKAGGKAGRCSVDTNNTLTFDGACVRSPRGL